MPSTFPMNDRSLADLFQRGIEVNVIAASTAENTFFLLTPTAGGCSVSRLFCIGLISAAYLTLLNEPPTAVCTNSMYLQHVPTSWFVDESSFLVNCYSC